MKGLPVIFCLLLLGVQNLYADIILSTSLQYRYKLTEKDAVQIPPLGEKDILDATEDMSALRIKQVREWTYNYLVKYPGALTSASHNARYYRAFVHDVFAAHPEFPEILTDLPILESSYNPKALSHAGAAGLWQFMPGTARGLNMSIGRWSDERSNLILSTESAITHLSYLHEHHGSWELALAAYNCGSGRIDNAVQQNPGLSYWELVDKQVLPLETSVYVQKFSALSIINRNRKLFGFDQPTYNSYKMRYVTLKYPVAIKDLAHYSGIPESVIYFFNPQLKRRSTPLTVKNYSLLLPTENADLLKKNEEKLYKLRFNCIKRHTVKKGECLGKIAKKYNVPMQYIISINVLKKPYTLYPGSTLYIPVM